MSCPILLNGKLEWFLAQSSGFTMWAHFSLGTEMDQLIFMQTTQIQSPGFKQMVINRIYLISNGKLWNNELASLMQDAGM